MSPADYLGERFSVKGPTRGHVYSLLAHWVFEVQLWKKANGRKNHMPATWELLKNKTSEKAGFFSTSSRQIRFDCHLNWRYMKKATKQAKRWSENNPVSVHYKWSVMLMNGHKHDVTSQELSNFSMLINCLPEIWNTPIRFRLSCNSFKPCSIRKNHRLTFPYSTPLISFLIRGFTRKFFNWILRSKIAFFQDNIRKLQSTQELKSFLSNF